MASVCLAGIILLSFLWRVDWHGRRLTLAVTSGSVYLWWEPPGTQYASGLSVLSQLRVFFRTDEPGDVGWFFTEGIEDIRCYYRVDFEDIHWWFYGVSLPPIYYACVPLWMPLAALLVPTVLLHCIDRCRVPPHCCVHCGYDLTGNVTGRCSECGAVRATDARPSQRRWRHWLRGGVRCLAAAACGRTPSGSSVATWTRLMLIVLWHWVAIPGTQGLLFRIFSPSSHETDWSTTPTFSLGRVVDYLLIPISSSALAMMLLLEGAFCWLVFRRFTPRKDATPGPYMLSWWRTCLWGTAAVPVLCLTIGVLSGDRDTAMGSVALWVLLAPVLLSCAEAKRTDAVRQPASSTHAEAAGE